MVSSLKNAAIKRRIKGLQENSKPINSSFTVKKVGVIVDLDIFSDTDIFLNLKKWKPVTEVEIIGFSERIKENPDEQAVFFTPKEISLTGNLKQGGVNDFAEKEFDLLINYTNRHNLAFNLLTASSQAKFKVGIATENELYYDLIIKTKIEEAEAFQKELLKYLRILKLLENE